MGSKFEFSRDNIFSNFVKKYSLSKTLRFELKPFEETKPFLDKFKDLDKERYAEYKVLKKIIDEYHKDYIEKSLSKEDILKLEDLKELEESFKKLTASKSKHFDGKHNKYQKSVENLQKKLRKQIVAQFEHKKDLFKEDLIKKALPEWLQKKQRKELNSLIKNIKFEKDRSNPEKVKEALAQIIENFKKFTTYLTGFHKNRENIYSDKDQSTAVSYRIIHENFPKFLFNLCAYQKTLKYADLESELDCIKEGLKKEFDFFGIQHVKELFEVKLFNKCLTQNGIDNYNTIIGGKTEDGRKIQGVNEKLNLFRQKKQNKKTTNDKGAEITTKLSQKNLPSMQMLYKQILSDRESHSFSLDEFKNRKDLLDGIQDFWKALQDEVISRKDKKSKLDWLFFNLSEKKYDTDRIYLKSGQLSFISHKLFGEWSIIKSALLKYADQKFSTKKESERWNKKDFYSFQDLHEALFNYSTECENLSNDSKENDKLRNLLNNFFKSSEKNILTHYFEQEFFYRNHSEEEHGFFKQNSKKNLSFVLYIKQLYQAFENKFKEEIDSSSNSSEKQKEFTKEETEIIYSLLSKLMELLNLVKLTVLEKGAKKVENIDKDTDFYNDLDAFYNKFSGIIDLYNKTRNYIATRKGRLKKIKINFEDSTLLNGWDINKEKDNLAVILRKKEGEKWLYYLAVMNKDHRKLFDYHLNFDNKNADRSSKKGKTAKENLKNQILALDENEQYYEKMNYKLLPSPDKMLPKVFFSNKGLDYFKPSEEIKRIKNKKTYAKNDGEDFSKTDCHKLIDFYKQSLKNHKEWSHFFKFKFSPTKDYNDISDFFYEVKNQGYRLTFDKIKSSYIEEKAKNEELYLFQIYNKDFSKYSKGQPNLHTEYFNLLFQEANLKDTVFKLNGQSEIFYRAQTKEKEITHKKNKPIENKNPHNPKKQSTFKYDLIKDKRFTEDKFFFHVPVTLNFKAKSMRAFQFNQDVLKFLKNNKDINIIGIDRGERHLAYYTVIDQSGEILEQGSFNKIKYSYKKNGSDHRIGVEKDYHKLLGEKEKERDESRKSWTKIENIKELKAGYLSHLVHKIAQLMIKHKAIVVFEDLNLGFKRGRFKFEKQIYQKLEKALIDKLNYLVFKDKKALDKGGYLKAYQLTAPFESFSKIGRQTGWVFYTPAHYTSKVDPLTGFVNLIYPRYENVEKSQEFFKNFNQIYFDKENQYFVFEYQDGQINSKRKKESNHLWKVCTHGDERFKYDREKKIYKSLNVTEDLKDLFKKYEINYEKTRNIKADILEKNDKGFFSKLLSLLWLTLQMRYTNPNAKNDNDKDFILSPVADQSGRFFDSREAKINEPKNADANGAFHIAFKGLWMLKDLEKQKEQKLKINILKNKDWFKFITAVSSLIDGEKKAS